MKSVQEVLSDNELRMELYSAWTSAFSSGDDLDHFLKVQMGRKLADFTEPKKLPNMIADVALFRDDGDEWVKKAFQQVYRWRRTNQELHRFGDKVGWSPTEGAEDLSALKEIAEEPGTRRIILAYRGDIQKSSDCANAVGDIKRLHDFVDQMRRTVYLAVRTEARRLAQASGAERAAQLRGFLLDSKRQMVEWVRPPRFDEDEYPWIKGQLTYAADALKAAAAGPSPRHINDAIEYLRPVVEFELTSLDNGLAEAAKALDLARLVEKLEALRDELRDRGVDRERLAALERDIETLAQTDARLTGLIKLHRGWQRIDAALNQVENALGSPLDDIGRLWRVLDSYIRTVCPAGCDQSPAGLEESAAAFEHALAAREATRLKIAFPDLATLLRDRFTAIDMNLIDECERIRQVGISLNAVVEKLDGG